MASWPTAATAHSWASPTSVAAPVSPSRATAGSPRTTASWVTLDPADSDQSPAVAYSPALARLLDEAELYLLPRWADAAMAVRLLDQAAAIAPNDPRLLDLR